MCIHVCPMGSASDVHMCWWLHIVRVVWAGFPV